VTVLCLICSKELDDCSWLVSAVSKLSVLVGCIIPFHVYKRNLVSLPNVSAPLNAIVRELYTNI